jgi:DNA-binding beta-propeller fold protein YncE
VAAAVAVVVGLTRGGPPPSALHVAETIPNVGHRPNGIALAAGDLWVTSFDQLRIDRIDGATRRVLAQHPRVGLGASSIVASGTNLWVAVKLARQVVEIDARSGLVTRKLRPRGSPTRLAVGFGSLWVAALGEVPAQDVLVRYSEAGAELSRWPMKRGIAALATGAGAVWVAERGAPDVLRVDPRTGRTQLWARNMPGTAPSLYYSGGSLWGTIESADSIVKIDPRTPGGVVTTAAGHRPEQVVAAGGRLFVASNTDHRVLRFDPNTVREAGNPLDVEHNPYALAADAHSVWVTGVGENTVTRIRYR